MLKNLKRYVNLNHVVEIVLKIRYNLLKSELIFGNISSHYCYFNEHTRKVSIRIKN